MEVKDDVVNCHNKCYFDQHKKDFPKEHAKLIKDYPSLEGYWDWDNS